MKRLGNHSQRGAVLVFMALMLPILVFFSGMAIDFGRAYLHKSQLQNAADAAALAGVSAAAGSGSARLVDTIPSGFLTNGEANKLVVAKDAANAILVKNTGAASANESNTKLRMTKEGNDPKVDVDTYYYMVELTDEVKMVFAQFFLPERFLPNDWNVKVAAKAWAKARVGDGESLGGPDLLTQMKKAADENQFDFENLGKRVKELRIANDLTQNQVAEALHVTPGYISNVENDRTAMSLRVLSYYAKLTGITLDSLVGMVEPEYEKTALDNEIISALADMSNESKRKILDTIKIWKK